MKRLAREATIWFAAFLVLAALATIPPAHPHSWNSWPWNERP
jgi:hypothetical protein